MMPGRRSACLHVLALLALSFPAARGQDLLITEFQAKNNTTVADKDGNYSDWIELYNAGAARVDMSGWFLTDNREDLTRWRMPAVSIDPGEFRLVFASGKDLRDPAAELHTSFKLTSEGEYVALVAPDGKTIVWEYGPQYPVQPADFSYGLSMGGTFARLVAAGTPARVLVPSNADLGLSWRDPDFDDAAWPRGHAAVGFERSSGYEMLIQTDVETAMYGIRSTAYIRIPFTVDNPAVLEGLTFRIKYDDGFIAYINSVRVAAANAPESPVWNSAATAQHGDADAVLFQTYAIPLTPGLLRAGTNVLAIHGLNASATSSDFLILPELDAFGSSGELDRTVRVFLDHPTPGFSNMGGFARIAERPRITPAGQVFQTAIDVTMAVDDAGTEIRYTLDGSVPTESSSLYAGAPIRITESTLVRARGFKSGIGPSPVMSVGYIGLAADVWTFSSDLPLIVIDDFGGGRPPKEPKIPALMAIFEPKEGRSRLTAMPDLQTRIGIEVRGSSTAGLEKASYTVETWDGDDEDMRFKILGMPEDSDWVLNAAYSFDRALLRNQFMYDLSNQVGRYAVRSRFVEVFFNQEGGSLSYADYDGVYSFMEKISRGERRVDVESLPGDAVEEPEITGGYMLKIDRADPEGGGFSTSHQDRLQHVYPQAHEMTSVQQTWIRSYLQRFEDALYGADFRDPALGYLPYVDVDSWIDHHILNVFALNVDAFALSTYFYKTRLGKIEFGPIWDFDRSMGSTDSRDDNPLAWDQNGGSRLFGYGWWGRLFDDPDFFQKWIDRWSALRKAELSTANVNASIDGLAAQLQEAHVRNFTRWPVISPSQWPAEVNVVKDWLGARTSWIDSQFVRPPIFSSPGGKIQPGFQLMIFVSSGTTYYTLDGTDPRGKGGVLGRSALSYGGAITLNENTRIIARTQLNSSDWSGPAVETYVVTPTQLVVTELMYHPAEPPEGSPYEDNDYEFIELFNRGGVPIDLTAAAFVDGVEFVFPEGTVIAPGEYLLLVRNLDAFKSRYARWEAWAIVGQYTGSLENSGERIEIMGPLGDPIVDFTYRDTWWPSTDGDGFSLELADPFDPTDPWDEKGSWRSSEALYGSPGEENGGGTGPGGWQRPGDINQDGRLDISDAVGYLRVLFGSAAAPFICESAALDQGANLALLDLNGDSRLDVADAVYVLAFIFQHGAPPARGTGCIRIEGCPHVCGL